MCELSRTLGTGSSILMQEHLSSAANPDCGRSRDHTLGCSGCTFGLQWSDPLAIKCKVLSCYWKEDTSYPKQDLCFLLCHSHCYLLGSQNSSPEIWVEISVTRFSLQMGEPNQQTTGFPVLHTAGMCWFLSSFWCFSQMFPSVCRVQCLQCNRTQKISAYLWELSSCCLINQDDVEQLDNRK